MVRVCPTTAAKGLSWRMNSFPYLWLLALHLVLEFCQSQVFSWGFHSQGFHSQNSLLLSSCPYEPDRNSLDYGPPYMEAAVSVLLHLAMS